MAKIECIFKEHALETGDKVVIRLRGTRLALCKASNSMWIDIDLTKEDKQALLKILSNDFLGR